MSLIKHFFLTLTVLMVFSACTDSTQFNPVKMDWPDKVPRIVSVTGGSDTSLALDEDGYVWIWGVTDFDPWKDESIQGAVPVWNEDGTQFGNIKKIEGSGSTCYAIDKQGQLWAWGGDFFGKQGTAAPRTTDFPSPVVFADGSPFDKVISVSGANSSAFAIREDGSVWAWGDNDGGVLGVDEEIWRGDEKLFEGLDSLKSTYLNQQYGVKELTGTPYPRQVTFPDGTPLLGAVSVSAESFHVLILNKKGEVWGWGDRISAIWPEYNNTLKYKGNYIKTLDRVDYIPEKSIASDRADPAKITYIETAQAFSLAVLNDGTVLTWGKDMNGSLGHGEYIQTEIPDRMRDTRDLRNLDPDDYPRISSGPILKGIKQARAMNTGIILLTSDGRVFYQGSDFNGNGERIQTFDDLNDATPENIPILTPVSHEDGTPFTNIKSIGSDSWYTAYMIDENSELWAWGLNEGHLGDNTREDRLYPVKVKFFRFDKESKEWVEY